MMLPDGNDGSRIPSQVHGNEIGQLEDGQRISLSE
jgi:hypothetical protein